MKLKDLGAPTAIFPHPSIEGFEVELIEPDVAEAMSYFDQMSKLKDEDDKRVALNREILAKHIKRIVGFPLPDGKRADFDGPFDVDDIKRLETVKLARAVPFVNMEGKEVVTFERFSDTLRAALTNVETFNRPLGAELTRSKPTANAA